MRILLVSTMYPGFNSEYRGVFIRKMVQGLATLPELSLRVWAPPGELPDNVQVATTPGESRWLSKLVESGGISHALRSKRPSALISPIKLLALLRAGYRRNRDVDLYHINWIQCALPLPDNGKPALITALGNDLKLMKLPAMRWMLRRVMHRRKVAICPNADWMRAPLEAYFGDIAQVIPVPFGIDPAWYDIVRDTHRQPTKQWIAVTRLTQNKIGPLFEWSSPLFESGERELHLYGPMEEDIAVPDWVHYHGPATPDDLLHDVFPSATGLITLSQHAEGRPQVMLEAMAARIPIVASDIPAHRNLVDHEQSGYLCASRDDLEKQLTSVESTETNDQMGRYAQDNVRELFGTWEDCAKRYRGIYAMLTQDQPR